MSVNDSQDVREARAGTLPPCPPFSQGAPSRTPLSESEPYGEGGTGSGNPIDHQIRMRAMVETAVLWKHDHITTDEFYLMIEMLVK